MYKDKSKQQASSKERSRRYREAQKALQGVTQDGAKGVTLEGVTGQGVTELSPDMAHLLDKLTDPVWREKYGRICASLGRYQEHVSLGIFNMELVCDLLDVTA